MYLVIAWMAAAATTLAGAGARLDAQVRPASDGGFTTSLGQPGIWQWSVGGATGLGRRSGNSSGLAEARVGAYRELINPALGVGGGQLEAYTGAFDTKFNAGVRLRFVSPIIGIAAGMDYNASARSLRPILTYVHPVHRGGLFGDGSVLRADVVLGRDRTLMIGFDKPVFRRIPSGTTRPLDDKVRMRALPVPEAPLPRVPAELRTVLDTARDAALAIGQLAVPWIDHMGAGGSASDAAVVARLDSLKRFIAAGGRGEPRTLERETRRLHAAMDRAFTLAIAPDESIQRPAAGALPTTTGTSPLGRAAGDRARSILLREVLFPYDALLGQARKHDTTREFAVTARGTFLRWLLVDAKLPRPAAESALAVFTHYLETAELVRMATRRQWRTSRDSWLPLQLALLPEQHDTQDELDALVAEATGKRFSDGNSASYVINEQFQGQLSRTIREAKEYHVLITHDFRGYDDQGDPDEMSFRHVLRSYLSTLIARVKAYDSTGTFPVYMILLDEWFYQANSGRLWMTLLEDPTRHTVHLPPRFKAWEDSLRVAQDSLRAAIRNSTLISVQRRQYGEAWLRNLVKVHVNITNSADPSFWSWGVTKLFPLPDAWMRDHRKIVFYDLTEEDPYRGEAMLTGAGVGEKYANLAWEDRSLLMRGPAALGFKAAARDILLKQGIAPSKIPYALRPRPFASDYDARVAQSASRNARALRALQLHNGTGFDYKGVNVGKAVLYTLMPPGSVIQVPDALWNGTFWGSAMLGCALRGVRVLVIAPAHANAPAPAFGSMVRGREMLWRLLAAARVLAPEISSTGGLLKVGVFSSKLRVTDIAGKASVFTTTLERNRWLDDLFDFPPSVLPALQRLADSIRTALPLPSALGIAPSPARAEDDFEAVDRPYLHLKANFLASREAWTLMARADWVPLMSEFVQLRVEHMRHRRVAVSSFEEDPDALGDIGGDVVERWFKALDANTRERVVFFTVVGSANQNDRSFALDGEDALVVSRWPIIIAYLDLMLLIGQCEWIEDPAALDAYVTRHSAMATRVAHWFKLSF
ncbi:MAG: hypothetical protein ABIT38_06780 [Gemmatimonadaceae bacterium]